VLFLIPLLGIADWGQSTQSWLLSGNLGHVLAVVIGGLLWLVAIAGFIAVALGLLRQAKWLRRIAVGAALASLAGIVLFWSNPAGSSPLYAALFDLAVLFVAWRLNPLKVSVAHA
jgi:hypothetical protein